MAFNDLPITVIVDIIAFVWQDPKGNINIIELIETFF
jgi:hypothetical protein